MGQITLLDFMTADWKFVPPEARKQSAVLAQATDEQLDRLISSPDPRHRSMALFVLRFRGDVNRLASLNHWLEDRGQSVPLADLPSAGGNPREGLYAEGYRVSGPQPIGHLLSNIYAGSFGTRVQTPEEFRKVYGHITDFDSLAMPWYRRLQSAKLFPTDLLPMPNDQTLEAIKARVRALPPQTRAYVVAMANRPSLLYTDEEARDELRDIAPDLRARLRSDDSFRPPDPCFQPGAFDRSLAVRERILQLLGDAED